MTATLEPEPRPRACGDSVTPLGVEAGSTACVGLPIAAGVRRLLSHNADLEPCETEMVVAKASCHGSDPARGMPSADKAAMQLLTALEPLTSPARTCDPHRAPLRLGAVQHRFNKAHGLASGDVGSGGSRARADAAVRGRAGEAVRDLRARVALRACRRARPRFQHRDRRRDLDRRRDWLELFPFLSTRRPDAYGALAAPA
jgi:hypothetical protein